MSQVSKEDRETIMRLMSEKDSRKKLDANATQTLTEAGVSEGTVQELSPTLAEMDEKDFAAIAKINKKMLDAGLTEEGSMHLGRAV
jgi:hypothetical protein